MMEFRSSSGAIFAWRQATGAPPAADPNTVAKRRGWYLLTRRRQVVAWRMPAAAGAGADVTINCGVGNAVANGLDATITNDTGATVACDVGNAVADGLSAFITQDITVSCLVGNAVANGSTATITEGALAQQSLGGKRKRSRLPMVDPSQAYMAWARYTLAGVVSSGVLDG